jgi:endoribonuclease Dicer
MKKELQNYLYANEIRYGGKEANWLPPGYTINKEYSDRYLKQKPKRKAFADMIEALIGAFLVSTDYSTTLKFMKWLDLNVIPEDKDSQMMKTPSVLYPGLSETMNEVNERTDQFFSDWTFIDVEKSIGYTFKNKAYLIAAFTHPSYSNNNRLTQCYDRYSLYTIKIILIICFLYRLEYLGDAVLDFLVIRCIFIEHYNQVTPSKRSCLID